MHAHWETKDDLRLSAISELAHLVYAQTFAGQDEWMEELLGDEYYVELFAEIADSEPITEAIDEVSVAVDEAKNEHEVLKMFAEGADTPLS